MTEFKKILVVKSLSKFAPVYHKDWHEAGNQFWVNEDRLYVVYDDDHDDEDENGNHPLHDVSDQYDWKLV